MVALGITDTNNMCSALEFSTEAIKQAIQPIMGINIDISVDGRSIDGKIVLLAQNEQGYKNLMALSSRSYTRTEEDTYINLDWLINLNEGIIVLSGGPNGAVNKLVCSGNQDEATELLNTLKNSMSDRLYVELQRHNTKDEITAEEFLIDYAYANDIPLVATNEPNFIGKDMYKAHDALLAIRERSYVLEKDRYRVTPQHYMKTSKEMEELFSDLPEAISNTQEIAQRCAFASPNRKPLLPSFGKNEKSLLRNSAQDGLDLRLKSVEMSHSRAEYEERLEYELKIIEDMGFAGYFLIVADFIKWAKEQGIPVGAGRGSGAGSVVAWALTITDLDPLRYGLIFERFLNPDRVSMPDFDIDFCQERRGEVIKYVQEKYGEDKVAQIITFGTLQARAVVRDVGRVMQIPLGQVDRIAKMIPNNPADPTMLKDAVKTEVMLQNEMKQDDNIRDFINIAIQLEGLYRNTSTHAAGIVIGDRPLQELTPLYVDENSSIPATQFSMKYAENAGLVKFDFLGLKTLTVIDRCVKMLKQRGVEVDIDNLDLNDPKVYAPLYDGFSLGVFQLESSGMRDVLSKLRPNSLEELSALIALYRPGPMQYIPNYIARKFGNQEISYDDPSLEPILKKTYGIMVYQEQVMEITRKFAGYTLAQSDIMRRILGKKIKSEMDEHKDKFINGAVSLGNSKEIARKVFEDIEEFANYSFNQAHAVSYAYISFQTAYLKAYYPVEFIAASMSLDIKNTEKLSMFYQEARKMGVEIVPPCINKSEADFVVKNGKVHYALGAVKSTGLEAMRYLCDVRGDGFKNIDDFAKKVDVSKVNKRALEALTKSGAMDCLGLLRAQLFDTIPNIQKASKKNIKDQNSNAVSMFGEDDYEPIEVYPPREETEIEKLNLEFKSTEIFFSGHPLDAYQDKIKFHTQYKDIQESIEAGNSQLVLSGVLIKKIEKKSKDGRRYAFVTVLDKSASFEFIVGSDLLDEKRDVLKIGNVIVISAGSKIDGHEIKIFANNIKDIKEYQKEGKAKYLSEERFAKLEENIDCVIRMDSGDKYKVEIIN